MVSQRKLDANRANAAKSTGPQTDEGKQRASRNALRHGFFSRSLVSAGESREDLNELREALIDHLRPRNVLELMLVERIVSAQWKLVRLQAAEEQQIRVEAKRMRDELIGKIRELNEALDSSWRFCKHKMNMTRDEVRRQRDAMLDAADADRPTARLLAASFSQSDSALHRMSIYEQRLERAISRALRELRLMRADLDDPCDLPPSPYANQIESEPSEGAAENVRNEPTALSAAPATRVQASAQPLVIRPITLAVQSAAEQLMATSSLRAGDTTAQKPPISPPGRVDSRSSAAEPAYSDRTSTSGSSK